MNTRKFMISIVAMATSCSCLLLSGCKSDKQIAAEASASISPTTEATTAASSPSPEATLAAEASATPTLEPSPSATSVATNDTYKPGTLTATEYKSSYMGLQFTASKDYPLITKEQLQKVMGQGAKIAYGDKSDEVQELTENVATYEMMATSKTGYPNVSIGIEKTTDASITEEQYFEALKSQLTSLGTVSATVGDAKKETLCGQEYIVAPISMKVNSIEVSEKMYIRKKDSNFILITLTGQKGKESEMDIIMKQFSACE